MCYNYVIISKKKISIFTTSFTYGNHISSHILQGSNFKRWQVTNAINCQIILNQHLTVLLIVMKRAKFINPKNTQNKPHLIIYIIIIIIISYDFSWTNATIIFHSNKRARALKELGLMSSSTSHHCAELLIVDSSILFFI